MATKLTRGAALTGFVEVAEGLGLDAYRLADEAGVPRSALADPDLRIATAAVGRILELAAQKAGIDDLGLRLAQTRRLSNMGTVALIAREQPDLRTALKVMGQYQWMQSEGLSLIVEEEGDVALLSLHFARKVVGDNRQPVELSVGVLCCNIRALVGEKWCPQAVLFRHGPPARYDMHLRIFGVKPQFRQDIDGLVLSARELDAPLPHADPVFARHTKSYVEDRAPRSSLKERTGELIVLLLPTGTCTADRVAEHLGVTRRTLHRKLAAEGTDFSRILEEKRTDLVLALIGDARRSVTSIAGIAGFAGADSFSHWFRRKFRNSPRESRMEARKR